MNPDAHAILEFCDAIGDAKLASHAAFRLREEFASFGHEVEIDPRLWTNVIEAQRRVGNSGSGGRDSRRF